MSLVEYSAQCDVVMEAIKYQLWKRSSTWFSVASRVLFTIDVMLYDRRSAYLLSYSAPRVAIVILDVPGASAPRGAFAQSARAMHCRISTAFWTLTFVAPIMRKTT